MKTIFWKAKAYSIGFTTEILQTQCFRKALEKLYRQASCVCQSQGGVWKQPIVEIKSKKGKKNCPTWCWLSECQLEVGYCWAFVQQRTQASLDTIKKTSTMGWFPSKRIEEAKQITEWRQMILGLKSSKQSKSFFFPSPGSEAKQDQIKGLPRCGHAGGNKRRRAKPQGGCRWESERHAAFVLKHASPRAAR